MKKISTFLAGIAFVLILVGVGWIIALSAAANAEFNYQVAHVSRHGNMDFNPHPEFDLNDKYGETWGIAAISLLTLSLLTVSYALRCWDDWQLPRGLKNFIRFRGWELGKLFRLFRPHFSMPATWRRKRYSNLL